MGVRSWPEAPLVGLQDRPASLGTGGLDFVGPDGDLSSACERTLMSAQKLMRARGGGSIVPLDGDVALAADAVL
jgi:hypothetical protein